MTEEQWQRKMEFIVEQQAQFAASHQQLEAHFKELEAERIRDRPRMAELELSFTRLVELATLTEERMDNGEFRVTVLETRSAALEASMAHLAEAQAHADERVSALIDIIIEGRPGPSPG